MEGEEFKDKRVLAQHEVSERPAEFPPPPTFQALNNHKKLTRIPNSETEEGGKTRESPLFLEGIWVEHLFVTKQPMFPLLTTVRLDLGMWKQVSRTRS